jgi:hypothetical protein
MFLRSCAAARRRSRLPARCSHFLAAARPAPGPARRGPAGGAGAGGRTFGGLPAGVGFTRGRRGGPYPAESREIPNLCVPTDPNLGFPEIPNLCVPNSLPLPAARHRPRASRRI